MNFPEIVSDATDRERRLSAQMVSLLVENECSIREAERIVGLTYWAVQDRTSKPVRDCREAFLRETPFPAA